MKVFHTIFVVRLFSVVKKSTEATWESKRIQKQVLSKKQLDDFLMKNNQDNSGQSAGRKCPGMEVQGLIVEKNAVKFLPFSSNSLQEGRKEMGICYCNRE